MARVPASEATRKRLKEMFEGNGGVERSALVREAVRLIIEEALEAEVAEELGRGYFERGAEPGSRGHRNGYRLGKLDTAEGRIEYAVPQVRGIEGWHSEVRSALGRQERGAGTPGDRDVRARLVDARHRSGLYR